MENEYSFNRVLGEPVIAEPTLGEALSQATEKVSEVARTVVDRIDSQRGRAAAGLSKTATAVQQSGNKVKDLTQDAAGSLASTAGYIRDNDLRQMISDLGTVVKRNPGPSLVVAGVAGFLVGRTLSSRNG